MQVNEREENISSRIREFSALFEPLANVEIIPWTGNESVGLSILKDYPDNISFVTAKNKNGGDDSVTLLKIGYSALTLDENPEKVDLKVFISKVSRYLLDKHWDFNFEDETSPTKESIEESKSSRQPLDLEELSRYEFYLNERKFYDRIENKYIEPSIIAENIYRDHLKTLTAFKFRAKMTFRIRLIGLTYRINDALGALNYWLFGRQLKKSKDLATGIFKPYPSEDLIDVTTEKIKILNSDIPITNHTARTFSGIVLIIFFVRFYLNYDILGIDSIIKASSVNVIYSTVLVFFILAVLDRVIPRLVLILINLLIRLRLRAMKMKIQL